MGNLLPSPPGDTIQDLLDEREISAEAFGRSVGLTDEELSALLVGELEISPELAAVLSRVLGAPTDFWLRRGALYREALDAGTLTHDPSGASQLREE